MKGRIERLGIPADTQAGRKELAALLREKEVSRDTLMIAARTLEKDSFLLSEMRLKIMGLHTKYDDLARRYEMMAGERKDGER